MKIIATEIIVCIMLLSINLNGQRITSDEYWDAYEIAIRHYDKEEYSYAADAFKVVWTKPNTEEIAWHRLRAAAANCMIDNEEGVKSNLFKIIDVATTDDVKRVLVNYEIFNKYKSMTWWSELELKLNQRIENLIAHHKNLKIFKKGRNILYSAIRINEKGDTLANTIVSLIPDGTGWGDKAAPSQSQVIFRYKYTEQDSIEHIEEVRKTVGHDFWINLDTTGVIEKSSEIWMHPIRNNEFFKTEIAPFPLIRFPVSDSLMQTISNKTMILKNWGQYTGSETEESYSYVGETTKSYPGLGQLKCHKLLAEAYNNFHGLSKLEYYFNSDLGFIEMNYTTYDNDKIEFKIIGINQVVQN